MFTIRLGPEINCLLVILISACHSSSFMEGNINKLESPDPHSYHRELKPYYKMAHRFATGLTLYLSCDSTFTELTCANEIKGSWFIINDSLYLHRRQKRFMNKTNLPDTSVRMVNTVDTYLIRGKYLINTAVLQSDSLLYVYKFNRDIKTICSRSR